MSPGQTLFRYSLSAKIDLIDLAQYDQQRYVSKYRDIKKKEIKHRVGYSARNYAKSSFSDVTKLRNSGWPIIWSQMV